MASVQDLLRAGLTELEAPVEQAEPLARLAGLLERWSARMSLTAHRDAEAIARRLLLDAVALDCLLPETDSLADVGSGPGLPGLVLALLRPGRCVTLVESRERPHHFQRAALRELQLENVRTLHGRAEDLPATPHGLVVAQAVAPPPEAARLALAWVESGGHLALPGAESPPEVGDLPEVGSVQVLRYQVPLGGPRRTLWLARRRPAANPAPSAR